MNYCIVDIETTGGNAFNGKITEIAIFVHNGDEIVEQYETLINPEQAIPYFITSLTGISNAMVASAPTFEEVAEKIYSLLNGNIFIAHNVNFDYSFIKQHFLNSGINYNASKLCTVRLARKVFPGLRSYSLGNICKSLDIEIENRHRAGGDALATVRLFEQVLQTDGFNHIDSMLRRTSGEQWLPMHLDKKFIEQLPQSPGVYYFLDKKGKILYVGKAINIKKRVKSHFSGHSIGEKRQSFLRNITEISFRLCSNELHALVLESTEIKRLWPKYNYSQKEPLQKYGLFIYTDSLGYHRLFIDKKLKSSRVLATFNLQYDGVRFLKMLMEEFDLHPKLCLINKLPIEKDDWDSIGFVESYNAKVDAAIKYLNRELPSYAIVEEQPTDQGKLCLLMLKGSFYGMGYLPSDSEKIEDVDSLKEFIQPYSDNNFIRKSMNNYAARYPEKVIRF